MVRRRKQSRPMPHPLHAFVAELIEQGTAYADIEKALVERGLSPNEAETLVAQVVNVQADQGVRSSPQSRAQRELNRSSGLFDMLVGSTIFIVAGGIGMAAFAATRGDIIVPALLASAMVYGLVRFTNGFFRLFER
ncbi:MAG: hypothetical protein SF029_15705 [bacterium]|nr:hypothetical protein [bacterium]